MIQDPRIEWQKFIEQTSKFCSGLVLAVTTGTVTVYIKFAKDFPEGIYLIMAFGWFINALICVAWRRKIQIWIERQNALVEFYKGSSDKQYKHYFEFEEMFLESKKKELKFTHFPSTTYYDVFLPLAFESLFIGLALLFISIYFFKILKS